MNNTIAELIVAKLEDSEEIDEKNFLALIDSFKDHIVGIFDKKSDSDYKIRFTDKSWIKFTILDWDDIDGMFEYEWGIIEQTHYRISATIY